MPLPNSLKRQRAARWVNVQDARRHAHAALPSPILGYLEGGADDEYTLGRNTAAYGEHELLPRFLVDVSAVDTRTTVLGTKVEFPVLLSPTGMSRLFHPEAELAVARAAAKAGTLYCLSTVATESIETIAAASSGPKMFQVYVLRDQGLNSEFIQRCKAANYNALCLTVDVPAGGNRERDLRTGIAIPPRFGWRSKLSFAAHPAWTYARMTGKPFNLPNVRSESVGQGAGLPERMEYIFSRFDPSVSWQHAERMIEEWNGPFAIKGILSADDARQAAAIGASAVIVSNHGGRQLDSVPATFDCLQDIVDAVGDQMEVILDGGIRRGTDVVKAMAMGANACMIGRPYLYGLAAAGEAGVSRVLDIFRDEISRDLALIGAPSLQKLNREFLRRR
jgi:L-lactate dehydrogenase (cytochrome)